LFINLKEYRKAPRGETASGATAGCSVLGFALVLRSIEMTDFSTLLANLRRPRLLIRAASCGLVDYRRDRDLKRLLRTNPSPEVAVPHLLEEEARLEAIRRAGEVGYCVARHIEVLIALMAEVRLLPRPQGVV
jgi:hypothetical protein